MVATPPDVAEQAQQAAKRIAQELENRADAIMEGLPEDAEPPPEYQVAWRRTRAAESVVRCFEPEPTYAASRGCYEAYYATEDIGVLLILAKWALRSVMKLPWM